MSSFNARSFTQPASSPTGGGQYLSSNPGSYQPPALPNIPPRFSSPSDSGVQSATSAGVGERRPVPALGSPSTNDGATPGAGGVSASNLSASLSKVAAATGRGELSAGPSSAAAVMLPSPFSNSAAPSAGRSPAVTPGGDYQDNLGFARALEEVDEAEKARILAKHLVTAKERRSSAVPTPEPALRGRQGAPASLRGDDETAFPNESGFSLGSGSRRDGPGEDGTEEFILPYNSAGGDVTHDLYKWAQAHRPQAGGIRKARSASFSHPTCPANATVDSTFQHIHEPGGFRRAFIRTRAREGGQEAPNVSRNLVEFLYLYGHFAGEDLEEEDEEDEDEGPVLPSVNLTLQTERSPLLQSSSGPVTRAQLNRSLSRRRKAGNGINGTATVTDAVFMLLKGFIGTGVLFMGKAFFNGGILFSACVLLGIGMISLWSFLLLVKTRLVIPGSFGDIGGTLYGPWMRNIILASIALSQCGFVSAYVIFVAENLQAFVKAVTHGKIIDVKWLILAQMVVFLPLSLIRSLAKLSGTALIADAFILIGLIYIASNEITVLKEFGMADVKLFNPIQYPLLIGTAVFAFEGIGLIIPITESMKEPHKFPAVLSGCMIGVSVLFACAGVLSYAAYGSHIQTVVISNLPQEHKFVQVVQFLYSVAILLSTPLQLFPAVRIMENGLFTKSGKGNPRVKWRKNIFRGVVVSACMLLAWVGSNDLDKFVSIIGSSCCIPLCYIYPPLLHLRSGPLSRTARMLDYLLVCFGAIVCVYTTWQTIGMLSQSA